jgi:hypothetical protein
MTVFGQPPNNPTFVMIDSDGKLIPIKLKERKKQ